jgi:hypothetical protein
MAEIFGFPYTEVEFNRNGTIHDPSQADAASTMVAESAITDLVVISHGWNNDMAQARALYRKFFRALRKQVGAQGAGPVVGVVGVLWPSKEIADRDLKAGDAAAGVAIDLDDDELEDQLDELRDDFEVDETNATIDELVTLVPDLEASESAQRRFVDLARTLLQGDVDDELSVEIPPEFFALDGNEILDLISRPSLLETTTGADAAGLGGAADLGDPSGEAALFGGLIGGIKKAASDFLNTLTYYKMKQRAGDVGEKGTNTLLLGLHREFPALRIHLIGHSFGGRLVTAAVRGPDAGQPAPVASMTLLQAAYSHNGLAEDFDGDKDGYYRAVIANHQVTGPVLITHTKNDKAVGKAYPLASRIARQDAAALGDENDRFGGMGRNGAQHTPEAEPLTLLDADGAYTFEPGVVYNLQADDHIKNHGAVANNATANAVWAAITAT